MKLDELQKLCDEATAGPWTVDVDYVELGEVEQRLRSIGPITYWAEWASDAGLTAKKADSQFIVAARTYMPILIEVARAAKLLAIEAECEPECEACIYNTAILDELDIALENLEKEV